MQPSEARHSAALMRVNHVGEVCAQALYTAQALGARVFYHDEALARHLEHACQEEQDHLAWTQERIGTLGGRTSLLNPLWCAGAFGLGLLASRLGRGVSLGFVAETERQVGAHLHSHLHDAAGLPAQDAASKAIVQQMHFDELQHAQQAVAQGARPLPRGVQCAMQGMGKVMTTVAYRV